MSQKGGLARGYKPVVGVRAFLAGDQTEGSVTAKSDTVFFPHSASPYHCCSTMTAAHALGYNETLKAERKNLYLLSSQILKKSYFYVQDFLKTDTIFVFSLEL